MSWRKLDSGLNTAAWNLAIDEAIWQGSIAGNLSPTIRFYGWQPSAVSLGCFQKSDCLDLAECRRQNLQVVRRLSGGYAAVHCAEITISLAVPFSACLMPGTITGGCHYLSEGALSALSDLGVDARFRPPSGAYGHGHKAADASRGYQITVDGYTVAEIRQVRNRKAVLQQISLLLDYDAAMAAAIFVRKFRLPGADADNCCQPLCALLDRPVAYEEIHDCLIKAYDEILPGGLESAALSRQEALTGKALFDRKYSQDSWTFKC